MISFELGTRQKRWARWIGYPAFGLFAFAFALHYTFPYERLEAPLRAALGNYYDVVDVDVAGGWWPGDVVVRNLTLRSRPERAGDKPIEVTVDEIDLDVGFWAALAGKVAVQLRAKLGEGVIEGEIVRSAKEVRVDLSTDDLPLVTVPGIKAATGGVPLEGPLDARFQVRLPGGKWKQAEGLLTMVCEGCTIGDGKAKIRPMARGQTNAFSEEGFTLPKLRLGRIEARIEIEKGYGEIAQFGTKSPDGELSIEGNVRFEDPFERSQVTAYMKFRSSDELRRREPKMADMETMMGVSARRDDGFMGLRITGPISALHYLPSKTSPVLRKVSELSNSVTRPRGVFGDSPARLPPLPVAPSSSPGGAGEPPAAPPPSSSPPLPPSLPSPPAPALPSLSSPSASSPPPSPPSPAVAYGPSDSPAIDARAPDTPSTADPAPPPASAPPPPPSHDTDPDQPQN